MINIKTTRHDKDFQTKEVHQFGSPDVFFVIDELDTRRAILVDKVGEAIGEVTQHYSEKTHTVVRLDALDVRAIHAAIQWAEMLEEQGKLEIYDYQKTAFAKLKALEDKS